MESEAKNFFKAWAIVFASLCYSYFIASKTPKGKFRFFSLLPIFSIFTLLPLTVSRPLPSILLGSFITWLANFKLLLYSFNKGPLSTNQAQKSIIRFIIFAAFPIKIKEKLTKNQVSPNKVLHLNWGAKVVIFALLEVIYHYNKNRVVFCCLMYLSIDIVVGACDFVMGATLGLELDPPSDEPYLSTSLQDFWGRRWNRIISDILRHTIYKPVQSTFGKFVGSKWASLVAVMAAFIISGLMHELVFYYMTRVRPTWEVTWFFVLHGVCVILEMVVKRALGHKWRLHWALSGPLTIGFVMGTAFWLFFPYFMRNHVDVKATEDILALGTYLEGIVRLIDEISDQDM